MLLFSTAAYGKGVLEIELCFSVDRPFFVHVTSSQQRKSSALPDPGRPFGEKIVKILVSDPTCHVELSPPKGVAGMLRNGGRFTPE
jgi:hypothetical protein